MHRYMIDAKEAEARERAAVDRHETQVRAAAEAAAVAEERAARREASDRVSSLGIEEAASVNGQPDAKQEARARKRAARHLATLEKKEARERKALAKAAARRRSG